MNEKRLTMLASFHAEDPHDPSRCIRGGAYTKRCQGGHPVLRVGTGEAIIRKAATSAPCACIAEDASQLVEIMARLGHRNLTGLVASAAASTIAGWRR